MAVPKVLGNVTSCGRCPNYLYYSGGVYRCSLVDEAVLDKSIIAPFCPLPDYPSRTIAEMQTTILGLREPLKYGFGLALMTHIATKLKLNLSVSGSGIAIPFKDMNGDRQVYLMIDYIREVTVRPFEVAFQSGDGIFKLSPDTNPPLLYEATDVDSKAWNQYELVA